MKLKNPKGSTFESTGLLVLGLVGGAMLGRGLMAIVPNKTGLTEAEMKKQELMNYGARILIAGGGVTGAAYAKENAGNALLQGLGLGAAGIQVVDTVQQLASKSAAVQSQVASGKIAGKFVGKSLGLACPCDNMRIVHGGEQMNGVRKKTSRLRGPGYSEHNIEEQGKTKFQRAIEKGAMAS